MGARKGRSGTGSRRFGGTAAVWALLCLTHSAAPAADLHVEEVTWGFDGQVVAGRFNLLSVRVSNPTPVPFEGTLRLRKSLGGTHPIDAEVIEPDLFVAPFTERWVQLAPYIDQGQEAWNLSWGRGPRQQRRLDPPRIGRPARVLLIDREEQLDRGRGMRRFHENLFPSSVTVTDGLAAVVLDHVPRWEESRRQAFLDWLWRGGTVHLLHGPDRRFPRFPPGLADLNQPFDEFRIGSGQVIRHPVTRAGFDPASLRRSDRTEETGSEPDPADDGFFDDPNSRYGSRSGSFYNDMWFSDPGNGFFDQLKRMTRPEHNWVLIYLLALLYIGLIFPGFYLLGRRRFDYRLGYAAFLGVVALFSLAFATIGRRGYGETTTVNAVAVAQALPGNALDVSQWSNAFVTRGAQYDIVHSGSGVIYSTCQDTEAVDGVIRNGAGGHFSVDIPPFSSRTFGHRIKLREGGFGLKVEEWQAAGETLGRVVLAADGELPKLHGAHPSHLLYRNRFYTMRRTGERLELIPQPVVSVSEFLGNIAQESSFRMGGWYGEENVTDEHRFRQMYKPLMVNSLNIRQRDHLAKFSLPADRARVFVYAEMPESFFIQNTDLGAQRGFVLYVIDVFP